MRTLRPDANRVDDSCFNRSGALDVDCEYRVDGWDAARLEIRLLGGCEVLQDGAPVLDFEANAELALLALAEQVALLFHSGWADDHEHTELRLGAGAR